ncbi:MAG: ATP-dependent helicase [Pseudomonadota bacterium]
MSDVLDTACDAVKEALETAAPPDATGINGAMSLNPQQTKAVRYGVPQSTVDSPSGVDTSDTPGGPLLIMAGAGTGKTTTIAHRVAWLLANNVSPASILLMTFSRRAAREMTQRAVHVLNHRGGHTRFPWAGTFHGIAHKLLRQYARHISLAPEFSILDRSDAADLMDVCRQELNLSSLDKRFPRKSACLEIYSLCTNRQQSLEDILTEEYPWCRDWEDELGRLFKRYVSLKQHTASLDYDDLLLYWYYMMQEPWLAKEIGELFSHVLVDEYQDTNLLQASILKALKPSGAGVTVVGDDAQSIYRFRAADVNNIREFAAQYDQPAAVIDLEQNYRSHQRILDFANTLMHGDAQSHRKRLRSAREEGEQPFYVTVEDDACQARYIAEQILRQREDGIALKQQAVLFRNSHHSDRLEVELARRNIPFVKYGGLKFLEASHVKDLLCLLRWGVNPKDQLAGFRSMQLLSGIGPKLAQKAWDYFTLHACRFDALARFNVPESAKSAWRELTSELGRCASEGLDVVLPALAHWYQPQLDRLYDDAGVRWQDVNQLMSLASQATDAEHFLADLTLDPPSKSGDLAGAPLKDEDYLILSTVHSAKGQEWHSVFVLNVVDGSFPSEFATGKDELIEEERRLLYVAATRAKDRLHLLVPLRFYVPQQPRHGDNHVYGAQSRFMTHALLTHCQRTFYGQQQATSELGKAIAHLDLPSRISDLW